MCCICRMNRMLVVELWLPIDTRLRLVAVQLISTAGPLRSSQFLYGTILITRWHEPN